MGTILRHYRPTGGVVIAAVLLGVGLATPAEVEENLYLNALSTRGVQVVWQSRPILVDAGHAMCNDLRNGASPEELAARYFNPNATPQNLRDIANAAQQQLCPDTIGQ